MYLDKIMCTCGIEAKETNLMSVILYVTDTTYVNTCKL